MTVPPQTMRPTPVRNAGVVDLLDRLLEKGLVLNADVLVTLAGVPLLGVKLRLLLAGISTMLRYGMMRDWEAAQRAAARLAARQRPARLDAGIDRPYGGRVPLPEVPHVLWYLMPQQPDRASWRLGPVRVRDGHLHWQAGPEEPAAFSLFPATILHCHLDVRIPGRGPRGQPVLEVYYMGPGRGEKACFSGPAEALRFWANVLREARHDGLGTCPACHVPGPAGRLLSNGCLRCGWRDTAAGSSHPPNAYRASEEW